MVSRSVLLTTLLQTSVDPLLDSFNSKVKNVIDDVAPVKVSKKTGRQNHLGENQQQFRV